MASEAYESANPRQQELLRRSAAVLGGFSAENDITNVIYAAGTDVPLSITFSNARQSATRNVVDIFGNLGLRPDEIFTIRQQRQLSVQLPIEQFARPGNGLPSQPEPPQFESFRPEPPNILDPTASRLSASGLNSGAIVKRATKDTTVNKFPSSNRDLRVKISDPSGSISKLGGALEPLKQTDYKVVFPFTPEISLNHSANYIPSNPTHSNYEYLFYQNSTVSEITINGIFVARTAEDADYVLAVQHFFRSVTKMFYGQDAVAGLPPIVCRLEGHGDLQFSYVPIVITGFSVNLPSDVDYISATKSSNGRVPTSQTMSIIAKPIYSRSRITNNFSLTKFAQGALLGDPDRGTGGFI